MNTIEFHKSTTKELLAIKDRVRNLINHWGEDGRYKEAVLKTVIERFLPERFKIATGFVAASTTDRSNHNASNQLDIIIYDKNYPVLFKEGDFVVVTADSVIGIIEVKANLENQNINTVLQQANENGKFIYNAQVDKRGIFNGVFSFEGYERLNIFNCEGFSKTIVRAKRAIENETDFESYMVNHICLNKDIFYKFWHVNGEYDGSYIYKVEDLSFSFFISNLISYLTYNTVSNNSNLWFPLDKSILSNRIQY